MSRLISKKRALLATAATSLALVAMAFAWYTTTGSGADQSAGTTAGGYATNLVITSSANAATLVPGGEVTITGNIANNNDGSAKHGTLVPTVTTTKSGCVAASNFTVDEITFPEGSTNVIPAHSNRTFSAKLNMVETGGDQDNCKSAPLEIDWSS